MSDELHEDTQEQSAEMARRTRDTVRLFEIRADKLFEKIGPEWCKNLRMNLANPGIQSNHQVSCVPVSPKAAHSRRAWIFASGASLQQYESILPELVGNDFVLVSPTCAPWFVYHAKRMPSVVFAIDRSDIMLTDCMNAGLKGRPRKTGRATSSGTTARRSSSLPRATTP